MAVNTSDVRLHFDVRYLLKSLISASVQTIGANIISPNHIVPYPWPPMRCRIYV